jgi:hypothetical protein
MSRTLITHAIDCDLDEDCTCDAMAQRDDDIAEGRALERATVVEWLAKQPKDSQPTPVYTSVMIEGGEHVNAEDTGNDCLEYWRGGVRAHGVELAVEYLRSEFEDRDLGSIPDMLLRFAKTMRTTPS